jgi:hypothetical protein
LNQKQGEITPEQIPTLTAQQMAGKDKIEQKKANMEAKIFQVCVCETEREGRGGKREKIEQKKANMEAKIFQVHVSVSLCVCVCTWYV